MCIRKLVLAAGLLGAGCAAQTAKVDWNLAGRAFAAGEAVDDGAFPLNADDAIPEKLRLPYALDAAQFFGEDGLNERAYRQAADDAELQLRRALAGDRKAFQLYFEALGQCSTQSEAVRYETAHAIDAPADE